LGSEISVAPVKVAIVLSDGLSAQGGIGRVMTYLVREIEAHVPDIRITVYPARFTDNRYFKHLTVPFALIAFVIGCAVRRIEVAHINVAPFGSTWRKMLYELTARALGMRVVLHLHGSGYDVFYNGLIPERQKHVRAFFARADRVVALSDYWKRFLIADVGVAEGKIVEIANGVFASEPMVPRLANALPTVVFLGVVGRRKGVDTLIDALGEVSARGFRFKAIIAGGGDIEPARLQVAAKGIASDVEFPGWVGEVEVDRLLHAADIFVLPSRAENQPVSILEAMARGVPVIASNVGAIPDQVLDGQTGLLVPPGDVTALAEALGSLLGSPDLRTRYGEAGRARFEALFSVSICAAKFVDLYRSLRRG
jgi:glycosyltransferase involved in cell wall biosynthesis